MNHSKPLFGITATISLPLVTYMDIDDSLFDWFVKVLPVRQRLSQCKTPGKTMVC